MFLNLSQLQISHGIKVPAVKRSWGYKDASERKTAARNDQVLYNHLVSEFFLGFSILF
jgi:hypothetical protein